MKKFKKFFKFIWELKQEAVANEIMPLATTLTYRLIFALFPFLIFLISLAGYINIAGHFNIEPGHLMAEVSDALPQGIAEIVNDVINEVVDTRNPAILSGSLLLSLFTVANGFRAIMRGINRVYGQKDRRHIVKQWAIAGLLVLILTAAIIVSFLTIFGALSILLPLGILIFAVILIYRFASSQKHRLRSLLPGALLTVVVWAASTAAFNIYINNFSNLSLVYGSIASVFITMLWLNIISITILLGAQLNAKLKASPQ